MKNLSLLALFCLGLLAVSALADDSAQNSTVVESNNNSTTNSTTPSLSNCQSDSDCNGTRAVCTHFPAANGQPESYQCRINSQGNCDTDVDCPAGLRCWYYRAPKKGQAGFNLCTNVTSQSNCESDTECPAGNKCLLYPAEYGMADRYQCTSSVPQTSDCKTSGTTCPTGQSCVNSMCMADAARPNNTYACDKTADCDKDYYCKQNFTDSNGQAVGYGVCTLNATTTTPTPTATPVPDADKAHASSASTHESSITVYVTLAVGVLMGLNNILH
eukprot:GILK01007337.1.p1 GENE.GILK01007337.1~~GILK01007337.1.p1  ORF type:complete len:273 (+),score=30.51 GILK01007337.1:204-1022(+)